MSTSTQKKKVLEFDRFRLDIHERLLSVEGATVPLTPKVFDLLVVLVEHPGELLTKEWLLTSLWPGTFVEEANLSVNISTLRKALEAAGGAHHIETVPKRGYRFVADVRTMETSPPQQTVAKDVEFVSSAPAADRTLKRWIIPACAIILAGVFLAVVIERFGGHPIESPSQARSLAVLPFRPLVQGEKAGTDSREDEYLATGMADALILKLSSVQKIKVRATSSVLKYYGTKDDPSKAGRDLKVDAVLTGQLQHFGQTIRVSVQLINAPDGNVIWADHFEDYYTNIFDVQDSISEKVAKALKIKLTEGDHRKIEKHATTSTEAFQLYMKAKYCEMRRAADAPNQDCIAIYEQAVAKDPNYALAYAGLSRTHMEIASMESKPDEIPQARAAADKAISLDDELPEAHLALGNVLFRGDWDWLGARREFERAAQLDENSSLAHWYRSLLLMAEAHGEQALSEMQTALALDPASANLRDDLGWAYYCNRRYAEAIAESAKAVGIDGQSYAAHHQLGKAYLQAGKYDLAQTEFVTTIRLNVGRRGYADLGQLYAITGRTAEAIKVRQSLEQSDLVNKSYESEYMLAVLEASLGNHDKAFALLDLAVAARLSRAVWMLVDPDMDPLRRDDRFTKLVRSIHLIN